MKLIYYFLQWHWKKYKFREHHLMVLAAWTILSGSLIIVTNHESIGKYIVLLGCVMIIVFFLKWAIWDPIYNSFQEYKAEQRNLLDKINYGEKDYERFRKR